MTAIRPITVSSPSCWRLRQLLADDCRGPTATPTQSATAIPTPIHICRSASRRPSLTRKAAMMPTISEASTPSRRVMTKVGIIPGGLLAAQWALGRPN